MSNTTHISQEELDASPETSLGILLDRALRKVSSLRLNDYYLGCYLDVDDQSIRLYFSDYLEREELENFAQQVEAPEFEVRIEETEEEGAGWLLKLSYIEDVPAEEFEVELSGDADVNVELSGDVDVQEK